MHYFDTSFLTPLVREEETSSRVARFVAKLPVGELAISRWAQVEFASLLARDVRMGTIGTEEASAADALLEDVLQQSFVVLCPAPTTTISPRGTCTTIRPGCVLATPCTSRSLATIVQGLSTAWTGE